MNACAWDVAPAFQMSDTHKAETDDSDVKRGFLHIDDQASYWGTRRATMMVMSSDCGDRRHA